MCNKTIVCNKDKYKIISLYIKNKIEGLEVDEK